MNKKWKVVLGLLVAVVLLMAQQPFQLQTYNGGGAVLLGHGTAAGVLRVELPTDGTGIVGLASGTVVNPVPQSTSTYAATAFDLSATAATNIKASAGNIYGWFGFNPNTSTCYLQFYNSASPTLGTSPLHPFGVLAGGSFNVTTGSIAWFNLSTAISTGQTTTATGSTQCSSPMIVTILYN
jgi:hypothetical protein